jgi:pimeloyl-ACP methyl ester carboxylesterase
MVSAETILEVNIAPQDEDNFISADFRLWEPEQISGLKGVLVLLPGWSGSSLDWHKIPAWRKFAAEQHFAILTCSIKGELPWADYDHPEKGSGVALLKALTVFGEKSNRPALAGLPLCLYGHSAGGQFAYHFARWKPGQVLAFATVKGGCHDPENAAPARAVPGLFVSGQYDEGYRRENLTELVYANRQEQALWCLAIEPNTRHEPANSPALAISFFESVIPLRLNPEAPLPLRVIDWQTGWLGNPVTRSVMPAANHTGGKITVWLPDAQFARHWRSFTTTK